MMVINNETWPLLNNPTKTQGKFHHNMTPYTYLLEVEQEIRLIDVFLMLQAIIFNKNDASPLWLFIFCKWKVVGGGSKKCESNKLFKEQDCYTLFFPRKVYCQLMCTNIFIDIRIVSVLVELQYAGGRLVELLVSGPNRRGSTWREIEGWKVQK